MNIVPKSSWLVKDNKQTIRKKSIDLKLPLSEEDELVMLKLIEFVRFSQSKKNKNIVTPAVGLAAPQIGHNVNMYYIRINKNIDNNDNNNNNKITEYALINPNIIGKTNQYVALKNGEGCLSVNNQKEGYVYRSYKIIVEAYDYFKKKNVKLEVKSYNSIVIQHEQDHLLGKLYYDHINKTEPWIKINNAIYL